MSSKKHNPRNFGDLEALDAYFCVKRSEDEKEKARVFIEVLHSEMVRLEGEKFRGITELAIGITCMHRFDKNYDQERYATVIEALKALNYIKD